MLVRLRRGEVLGRRGGIVMVGLSRGEVLGGRGWVVRWGRIEVVSGCVVAVALGLGWGCKCQSVW